MTTDRKIVNGPNQSLNLPKEMGVYDLQRMGNVAEGGGRKKKKWWLFC